MKTFKRIVLVVLSMSVMLFGLATLASPVNVNKDSPDKIAASLHGIGPAKAQAISTYCHKHTCQKPADLLHVKGIGKKTLAKFSNDLRFGVKREKKHAH